MQKRIAEFVVIFTSMRFAVSLLVLLAIASIIGTVLPQAQPYTDYAHQFGPFWFAVFKSLGFYDVYGTPWFLVILGVLVLSTASCLIRNTPTRIMGMVNVWKDRGRDGSKPDVYHTSLRLADATPVLASWMTGAGYEPRVRATKTSASLVSVRGRFYSAGYILTHAAIVIFCVGAMYNASLPLKWKLWNGSIVPETNFSEPVSDVPQVSTLPLDNPAYRGNVTLPAGDSTDNAFVPSGNGYLVQPLPFVIYLHKFDITYYSNGMPKDFRSDIYIENHRGEVLKRAVVRVNHPLSYRGVDIYQASFSDGGTLLRLDNHSLSNPGVSPKHVTARIGDTLTVHGGYQVKLKSFSLYNVIPAKAAGVATSHASPFVNLGPSMTYVASTSSGQTAEFKTFVSPITRSGQNYFLQGVRTKQSPFQYLLIPIGPNGGISFFMTYLTQLRDEAANGTGLTMAVVTTLFKNLVVTSYPSIMTNYQQQARLFQAVMNAMTQLQAYPVPFIITVHAYKHKWAAGLEVTKWPGTILLYIGSVLLVFGIMISFYMPQRRIMAKLTAASDGTDVVITGHSSRSVSNIPDVIQSLYERLKAEDEGERNE
ncbi:cytochrome c biogenesis protein ResB [Acidithiobacillus sp.]|jgi:cytochrome c biogenesis protein|uniref:cytochrome c biogenesis protein ResB n=1 Tax=Acidithiobacillus sp. TaxID=1872118 RepID=UPI0025C5EFFB|nr:cytochrome c biogenesis protein ResB [Acidithiobacillus sp.]MCK9188014.1 cytochrome c biogenesis protein ResB [Acidithiobacillus sp.]MCK9359974.1 cytochrome c biogenesis protein ResB [Acidithiobacillus sp.]